MSEIKPVYIAKMNDEIIDTANYFSVAQSYITDHIVDNTSDYNIECAINDEFGSCEIGGEYYEAYDIVNALGDVSDTFRSIIEVSVEEMCDMDVGATEECEFDNSYSISCGLKIVDDDGATHIINDEDLQGLDDDPTEFTATDGTVWNIAIIGGDYRIVAIPIEKEIYSYIIRVQPNGVPMVVGMEDYNKDRELFEKRLVELSSVGGMLLNLYEDDERVLATVYL